MPYSGSGAGTNVPTRAEDLDVGSCEPSRIAALLRVRAHTVGLPASSGDITMLGLGFGGGVQEPPTHVTVIVMDSCCCMLHVAVVVLEVEHGWAVPRCY